MRARALLNLALLLAALLLGWWVYREVRSDGAENRVSTRDRATVRSIVVERGGEAVLELERGADGRWRLLRPRPLPASEPHVDMLLRFLALPAERLPNGERLDRAVLGLAAPKTVLRFDDERFAFGDLESISGRRYVLRGDQVLLLAEGVSALAAGPWWNFIDRRLLAPGAQVAAVETADGRRYLAEHHRVLAARWEEASASVVKPLRPGVTGADLYVVLESGERLHWQVVEGDQPRLLRPDLGLAYHVSADTLAVLSARRAE